MPSVKKGPNAASTKVLACVLMLAAFGGWLWMASRQPGGNYGRGGCCDTSTWGTPLSRDGQGSITDEARAAAVAYARKRFGSTQGVEVRVTDYGCHIGADVYRNGKLSVRLAYRGNGRVEEIQ